MRSQERNLLTLTEFIEYFPKIHPYRFAQIGYGSNVANEELAVFPARMQANKCEDCIFEFGWQTGDQNLSRQDIDHAIGLAEQLWFEKTHFWPAPKYITNEEVLLEGESNYWTCCGENQMGGKLARLNSGYLQSFGIEVLTELAIVAVEIEDLNQDSIPDNFITAEFPVPDCTEACEIAAFFTEDDRMFGVLEEWEIRPLRVTIDSSGGTGNWTATIQGPSYLLVRPMWYTAAMPDCVYAREIEDTYVAEIAVYRRTTDDDQTGKMQWADGCSNPMRVACAAGVWRKHSFVNLQALSPQPTITNPCVVVPVETVCSYYNKTSYPDAAYVNYLAGYPREKNCRMNQRMARAIAHLAAALMPCKLCGCACSGENDIFGIFRSVRLYGEKKDLFVSSARQIDNSFGPQHGALIAWEIARVEKLAEAVTFE